MQVVPGADEHGVDVRIVQNLGGVGRAVLESKTFPHPAGGKARGIRQAHQFDVVEIAQRG